MANVLGELFGDIADAIREKTGDTATMKPAEFPAKISGIENAPEILENLPIGLDFSGGNQTVTAPDGTAVKSAIIQRPATLIPENVAEGVKIAGIVGSLVAGGGSSADVRYVTFMSYDGTVEYGKKAVAVGDDCADPLARGVFSTPTRESDVQYDYSFYGWATTPNGAANANWNKAVTEDRAVYANFAAAARLYTARFYDGSTLMSTQQVAYGSKATPPDTTKEGCTFDGWTPADLTIYGDTDFVGNWSELKGLYYFKSVSKDLAGELNDISINRDGTRLAMSLGGSASYNYPLIYDLEQETPVRLETPINSPALYYWGCDYNQNSERVLYAGNASGSGYIRSYNADGSRNVSISGGGTGGFIACSPASDIVAFPAFDNKKYLVKITNTTTTDGSDYINTPLASTPEGLFSGNPRDASFSPDGLYLAACSTSGTDGARIFNVSNGSHVKQITTASTNKVSWSGDSAKLAISLSSAPYVEIYDTNTWNKICDLSAFMTSAGFAEFVAGTSILVVGSGTTVRAFDMSGNTPQELENVPVYAAGKSVADIRSNFSGTRIGIRHSSGVEIWGMS